VRPNLDDSLSLEAFQSFRWLKAELVDFCRKRGLAVDGNKHAIRRRVAGYLAAQQAVDRTLQREP
jgi:hypothetical protein